MVFGKALAGFGTRSEVSAAVAPVRAAAVMPVIAETKVEPVRAAAVVPVEAAGWTCGKCSHANDAGAMKCNLCSAAQEAPASIPAAGLGLAPNQNPMDQPNQNHANHEGSIGALFTPVAQGARAGDVNDQRVAAMVVFFVGFFFPLACWYVHVAGAPNYKLERDT
jgi:hypothetical protein